MDQINPAAILSILVTGQIFSLSMALSVSFLDIYCADADDQFPLLCGILAGISENGQCAS
jgi:hypothetical protein